MDIFRFLSYKRGCDSSYLSMLATVAFLVSAIQPEIAFVARFYKSGNAKSRFEIYISSLDGKNQKHLPTTVEPNFVQWVGSDRLAWTSDKGVYTSKLSPWKPVLISGSKNFMFRESRWRNFEPGDPAFTKGYDNANGLFRLDPNSLKFVPIQDGSVVKEYRLSDKQPTEIPNPCNPEHPLKLQRFEPFRYWINGGELEAELEPLRAVSDFQDLWVYIGGHDSTLGDANGIIVFQSGKQPRTIFDDANSFDFWWSRTTYAYCTRRDMQSLGKKEVWTSELRVGDWTKGTKKSVLKGLVWVANASLRP